MGCFLTGLFLNFFFKSEVSIRERENLHNQMHRRHEVVLVGTSADLPPSLQKPLGECATIDFPSLLLKAHLQP